MAERPPDAELDPSARLAALRESGADRTAPVRLAYLDGLARRAAEQPEPIRQLLTAKIAREADQLAAQRSVPLATKAEQTSASAQSPLAELLAYIGDHAVAAPRTSQPTTSIGPTKRATPETRPAPAPELKSVAYFRNTWSKLSIEQQLTQTLAQAPENAGPMNSQHLVLRALKLMRDHAPDYLEGFMSYVDTLIWLEQASPTRPQADRSATAEGEKKSKTTKRSSGKR